MNILTKLTIRNLKLNKKRTLVTIIGIALATFLIVVTSGLFSSFYASMLKLVKEEGGGDFHAAYYNVNSNTLKYIENNREVANYYETFTKGYGEVDSGDEYRPYLYILAYDTKALDNIAPKLIEGRYPKNDTEIVIPEHIYQGHFHYEVGDKISLSVGERVDSKGNILKETDPYHIFDSNSNKWQINDEKIINTEDKTYTIVGIIERPSYLIEDDNAPYYTAITYGKANNVDNVNIYVRYKHVNNAKKELCKTITSNEEDTKKCLANKEVSTTITYKYNNNLLEWEGNLKDSKARQMLILLIAVIISIIVLTSIFVIRNSFIISTTERYKEIGMLKSIGATPKQIRYSVLMEGLLESVIAIPIGLVIGVLSVYLLCNFTNYIIVTNHLFDLTKNFFIFKINIMTIILAFIISLGTVILSTLLPAKRASKLPPIAAIREYKIYKIKKHELKVSKLTSKLFGIGGVIASKNLKRYRKNYRTTIISLVISIIIFLSFTSFMGYFIGTGMSKAEKEAHYDATIHLSQMYQSEMNEDGSVSINMPNGFEYNTYKEIINMNLKGIKDSMLLGHADIKIANKDYSDDYIKYLEKTPYYDLYGRSEIADALFIVPDQTFKKLTSNVDISNDEVGVLLDDYLTVDGETKFTGRMTNLKVGDEIKISLGCDSDVCEEKFTVKVLGLIDTKDTLAGKRNGFFIKDDSYPNLEKYMYSASIYLNYTDINSLKDYINKVNHSNEYASFTINDLKAEKEREQATKMLVNIFCYTFIIIITLIGVTNIFNVITTNMTLRRREFAMLKAIGMTDKEFKKMIRLESLLYGLKALVIGITLGLGLSYLMFKLALEITNDTELVYHLPTMEIIISIIGTFFIIYTTMRYSLNKINKQNIMDTIRNDNI